MQSENNLQKQSPLGIPHESDPLLRPRGHPSVKDHAGATVQDWLWGLQCAFGHKFLVFLFVTQHFMHGMESFTTHSHAYLYRAHSVPAPRMQILAGLTHAPHLLKPIIALVSDVFPIFGYRKLPYMSGASMLGIAGFMVVGVVPRTWLTIAGLVVALTLQNMQYSTIGLFSHASYLVRMQQTPEKAGDLVTFNSIGIDVFQLVGTFAAGIAILKYGPETVSVMAVLPACAVLLILLHGCSDEKAVSDEDSRAMRRKYFEQECEITVLCLFIFVAGVTMMAATLICRNLFILLAISSCVCAAVACCFLRLLSSTIAKFLIFGMLSHAIHLHFHGAMFYFMTDTPEQFPEGPHFNEFFYVSVRGSAVCLCSILGVWSYKLYLQRYPYRQLYIFTTIAIAFMHVLHLTFITRTNLRLGISDKWFVVCGEVNHIIEVWHGMLLVLVLARLCPKDIQATLIALHGGCNSLGAGVSRAASASLLEAFHINPDGSPGESVQFENLWRCIVIGAVLPVLFTAIFYRLIPTEEEMDLVEAQGGYEATSGWWTASSSCTVASSLSSAPEKEAPRAIAGAASALLESTHDCEAR